MRAPGTLVLTDDLRLNRRASGVRTTLSAIPETLNAD
jgi:hypothetical protein